MNKEKKELLMLLEERERRVRWNARERLSFEGYERHKLFFAGGAKYRERIFLAGNRVGKTVAGAYEVMLHLTGDYPKWWVGKRFEKAVNVWCAGDTGKTTRDILQKELMGSMADLGSGMIPKSRLGKCLQKTGVPEALEVVYVKHKKGGQSQLVFKSYDQRREGFQGTGQDVVWLDEEPPLDVYTECVLRTMTTGGIVLNTFTPLMGLSDLVVSFIPKGEIPENGICGGSRFLVTCTWDDAPHLTEKDKEELMESIPLFQRDARSRGIPQLGSGAIYPIPESDVIVDDFPIPDHWKKVYGMDVGWNKTAVVWGATDPDTGVTYVYSEYGRGQAEPVIHAEAIKSRGKWICGVIDPASRGRGQKDGFALLDIYIAMGLNLNTANNAVESGLYEVWDKLSSGRLKFFKSLSGLRAEYRIYRRDEKGNVVKKDDHFLDALRYMVVSGVDYARPEKEKLDRYGEFGYTVGIMQNKFGENSWLQ